MRLPKIRHSKLSPRSYRVPAFTCSNNSPKNNLSFFSAARFTDAERGLGSLHLGASDEALQKIAAYSSGDARSAYNVLEVAASLAQSAKSNTITDAIVQEAVQKRILLYDKSGEEHYNLISALHKSVRNSDPDAALYWLARMLEAGEDPLYVARRVVRMAVEDIGLAEPGALALCMAARDAVDFIGMPEGNLALAQAVVYLSLRRSRTRSTRPMEPFSKMSRALQPNPFRSTFATRRPA